MMAGLLGMVYAAFENKDDFYVLDDLNEQKLYNCARNIEIALWKMSSTRNARGEPLLLSNEGGNLSYAVEFGKITARLDLLAHVLEERYRRIGVNYAHGLLFLNFLPVQ